MNIPTGELFRDLQISYTEVFLLELLAEYRDLTFKEQERWQVNLGLVDQIKGIIADRFEQPDIESFLEIGYPRATSLDSIIMQDAR